MKRVLLKLSGEALAGDKKTGFDEATCIGVAKQVKELVDSGIQVAIVTGGGKSVLSDGRCGSIGYGIATAYAKEGANLVITGRNVKKLEDAKEELERLYGIKVLIMQADVNAGADNEAVVNKVVEETVKEFGGIDVLINNAQASASGVSIADHTTEQFNLAMYSGLYAAILHQVQVCLEIMDSAHTQQQKKVSVAYLV